MKTECVWMACTAYTATCPASVTLSTLRAVTQCLENAPVRQAGPACSAMRPVLMVTTEPIARSHVCASMGDPVIVRLAHVSVPRDFQEVIALSSVPMTPMEINVLRNATAKTTWPVPPSMAPVCVRKAGRKVTAHYLAQKECGASTATGLVSVSMGPPVVRSRGNASAPLDGLGRNVSYHARQVVLGLDVASAVNVKMQMAVTQ